MSTTIAVVGGGYGGAAVAKALDTADPDAEVVLIDPREAFVNTAGSLRTLVRPGWGPNMFFPFATMLERTTVLRDRVVHADPRGVLLASGQRVEADYLVLATGSSYAYPAKPASDATEDVLADLRRSHDELAGAARVLILGAGPVGLELAGEVKQVWPDKSVRVVDPAAELLPGFLPELRARLTGQLADLGVDLRLGTTLAAPPATEPGRAASTTVTTTAGEELAADIWFRAYGVRTNSDYLADGAIAVRNAAGQVPVTATLQVAGHPNVYALGDLTDLPEAKMAGYAMQHAEVVVTNLLAALRGETPPATYTPASEPMVLLPLGSELGVGQLPTPEGASVVPAETVSQYKGRDLFTARFTEQFGTSGASR